MQDFTFVTKWIHTGLTTYIPEWLAVTFECLAIGVALLLAYALLALFSIWFERKVCAYFQCRLGPNRVGTCGVLQPFADMFKILIKELIDLKHTDKFLFALAPYLVILASMLAFSVLPWGNGMQVLDFNVGIFFLLAVSSIGVLGILLAGWSSNNKFTLIGALRSGAQMVSWISLEDVIYAIHHLIATPGLAGPVNLTAPNPVSNLEYTKTLARILNRPALFHIPEGLIRGIFGQMGEEVLLSGSKVNPSKLLDSGFTFNHPDLTSALKETLGVR